MSKERDQFKNRVEALFDRIRGLAEPHEWVPKTYLKKMRDAENLVYEIPALLLQKGPLKVLLDPVAYDVGGRQGAWERFPVGAARGRGLTRPPAPTASLAAAGAQTVLSGANLARVPRSPLWLVFPQNMPELGHRHEKWWSEPIRPTS